MKPVDPQILLRQLDWRYATKKFDATKKIPAEDWKTLESALIATSSSYGLQPWHFVVVTNQKIKDQLMAASYGQEQVSHASHIVVFTVKKNVDAAYVQKYMDRIAEVRQVPVGKLDGFKGMIMGTLNAQDAAATEAWAARQVYIALGNLLTSAAVLGIDACPMEGISPPQYDQILGLDKKGYGTLMITTLGYRAADDPAAQMKKVRFATEDVVSHFD